MIELRNAFGQSPPPPGSYLEGRPTRAALESMPRAVKLVFEADPDRRSQRIAITQIAPRLGIAPQALRFWVRAAERDRVSAG